MCFGASRGTGALASSSSQSLLFTELDDSSTENSNDANYPLETVVAYQKEDTNWYLFKIKGY